MRQRRSDTNFLRRLASLATLATALVVGVAAADAAGFVGARAAQASVRPIHADAPHLDDASESAELTFDLSASIPAPTISVLANPDRILVDLPQVEFNAEPIDAGRPSGRRGRAKRVGLVSSVRFGLLAQGRSRIILALGAPAHADASIRTIDGKTTLVVALSKTDRASFLASARAPVAALPPPASAHTVAGRATIVLDPGHGGPDTGARVGGIIEKDVALAFAKSLAAKLETAGGFNVVMTRSSDVFIPLGERVQIARDAGAALMISIHADTLPETADVSGATVYTVSDKASDAYAAKVAAKENAADSTVGVDGQTDVADVNDILFDLTRQETRAYSHVFARTLVNYWKVAGRLNKNPTRAAGFVVLKAPDVPSVLLELGYLSNPVDSVDLSSEAWREKATSRMAEAIVAYFADRNGPAKAAAGVPMPLLARQATADIEGLRR